MTRPADIAVVGSINVDYVLRVPRLPKPGETLAGETFSVFGGGKGANQAVACARLGAQTALIACVGDDGAGRERIAALANDGVETSSIDAIVDTSTGSAMIFVAASGENCIGISAGANAELDAERISTHRDALAHARIVLVQLETPVAGVRTAVELAADAGATVILNPAPATTIDATVLRHVDLLTPNQSEATALCGLPCNNRDEADAASEALREQGPQTVIITLGADGAWVNERGERYHVPAATPKRIVDTVAAGDTFNGALAVALSEGQALPSAVAFANRAAAIAIGRHGAQDSIPFRTEV
ncbi:MAG: ribokinase [Pseudomonadota bacterium]